MKCFAHGCAKMKKASGGVEWWECPRCQSVVDAIECDTRREDAAGERERLEQLLYEHVRDRDEEAVELRIAFGIVPDMRDLKTQLLERAAALSTAERERDELHQQLGSAIDVARETMTEITTGRLASIGGIENTYCPQISVSRIKKLHERLVALADSYRARVPSGGEEGR